MHGHLIYCGIKSDSIDWFTILFLDKFRWLVEMIWFDIRIRTYMNGYIRTLCLNIFFYVISSRVNFAKFLGLVIECISLFKCFHHLIFYHSLLVLYIFIRVICFFQILHTINVLCHQVHHRWILRLLKIGTLHNTWLINI